MNRPLLVAALSILTVVALAWHHAGRPRPERLKGKKRLTLKERALLTIMRLGSFKDADEPAYEDKGQP